MSSAIAPETLRAYEQTEYRVQGNVAAVLQVGVRSAPLAHLHQLHQCACSAFITACNPLGQLVDAAVNAQRQAALAAELSRQRYVAIAGIGRHPTGDWPPEPSYLVLGLTRSAAQQLGRRFEQNALVWADADAIPQLILLR
jgi:hypothetical protein